MHCFFLLTCPAFPCFLKAVREVFSINHLISNKKTTIAALHYIKNANINRTAYDNCLQKASNYRPYALSWCLDALCETQWDLLVYGDYEAVLPLPYNRKWLGIKRIIQPLHIQQLGLFYDENNPVITKGVIISFFKALKTRFWFVYLHFSFDTTIFHSKNDFKQLIRPNYALNLQNSYQNIAQGYNAGMRYSMRKVAKQPFEIRENIDFSAWERLFLQYQAPKFAHFPKGFIEQAKKLIETAISLKKGSLYGVYLPSGELLAAAFYLLDERRITYLFSAASDEGRRLRAMHFLMDKQIQGYCGHAEVLDFEGSSIASIAEFYESFGGKNEPYFTFSFSRFPTFLI